MLLDMLFIQYEVWNVLGTKKRCPTHVPCQSHQSLDWSSRQTGPPLWAPHRLHVPRPWQVGRAPQLGTPPRLGGPPKLWGPPLQTAPPQPGILHTSPERHVGKHIMGSLRPCICKVGLTWCIRVLLEQWSIYVFSTMAHVYTMEWPGWDPRCSGNRCRWDPQCSWIGSFCSKLQ